MKKCLLLVMILSIVFNIMAISLNSKDLYLLDMVKISDIAIKFHAEKDSNAVLKQDNPYMIFSPESKVFFVNDSPGEEFLKINLSSTYLYNNLAYHDYPWGQLTTHTMFNYPYQNYKLAAVFIDPLKWSLSNRDFRANQEMFLYITQALIQQYMSERINAYPRIPEKDYPLFNDENLELLNLEMKALISAWESIEKEDKIKAKTFMEQFFSIRRDRWTKNRSYIMPFEQNAEMLEGYSAYQALLLYEDLHEYIASLDNNDEKSYFSKYFNNFNNYEYIYNQIATIYDGNVLTIQELCKNRLKVSGMLQFYILKALDWKMDNLNRKDLWYTLNDNIVLSDSLMKIAISNARTDSLFSEVQKQLKWQKNLYLQNLRVTHDLYNSEKGLQINLNYDHKSDELLLTNQKVFISEDTKTRIILKAKSYICKSKWFELKLYHKIMLQKFTKNSKSISWHEDLPIKLLIDSYPMEMKDSLDIEFTHLEIFNENGFLKIDSPGSLKVNQNNLIIELVKRARYSTDEEWWDKIEELNIRLMQKGIPNDWFLQNINHENFKMYLNMKRLFTSMPEHKVSRGEVSQDAYMKNFGVDQKVLRGKEFIEKYRTTLENAEIKHGIHYEMIMGILAIESDYGNPRFKGTFYTFPALVSQYILTPRRENFAINELIALYEFSNMIKKNTYHFIGSYAGAAGWGQFIPSSMKNFFLDSNDNFTDVDIYALEDNIVSIENYLYKNGLSAKNIDKYESRYKAIYSYNHSDSYVKAVLYMYDKLRLLRNNNVGTE